MIKIIYIYFYLCTAFSAINIKADTSIKSFNFGGGNFLLKKRKKKERKVEATI